MLVLRRTRQLLARLNHVDDVAPVESTTRLGDWYGNILRIGRQHLLFISERSRLPVVIPIREAKRLAAVFPDAVCKVLAVVGVSASDIADERSRMSEIGFGRTRNRSLLGTLSDFAFMAQYGNRVRAEPESREELIRFLLRTPILPLGGARPIDLTRAAFEVRSTALSRTAAYVAPVLDCPGALGRVKGSLAARAADAPLTRPARSQGLGNYRSDAAIRSGLDLSNQREVPVEQNLHGPCRTAGGRWAATWAA
jgi:hypothetical protein